MLLTHSAGAYLFVPLTSWNNNCIASFFLPSLGKTIIFLSNRRLGTIPTQWNSQKIHVA